MSKPVETPGEIVLAPVVELGMMMADAWKRSGCRGSSPLLLALRERRARVSGVEGGEKEKKVNDFKGRGRDFWDVVPRRRGSGKFKFPSRFLLGKVEENKVQQLKKKTYLNRTK